MDDKAELGSIEIADQPESRSARIWKSIRNLGRKSLQTSSVKKTVVVPVIPESPKIIASPELVDEQPDKPVIEDHQDNPTVIEEDKTAEKLRPAPKIFFHTTPNNNVGEIKKDGLLGIRNNGTLSSNLGYSLYFAEEHQYRVQGEGYRNKKMEAKLAELPDDYTMTVWTDNEDIKRGYALEYVVANKTTNIDEVNKYFQEFSGASPYQHMTQEEYNQLLIRPDTRKLASEQMVATIPLDRETRETILEQMILSEKGLVTSSEMEQKLENLFKTKNMWNANEETRADTIHGIVASMVHSLIRGAVTKRIEAIKKKSGGPPPIKEALQATVMLEDMINDPLSARYLESAKKFLSEQLTQRGEDAEIELEKITKKIKAMKENPERNGIRTFSLLDSRNQMELWGSSTTQYAKYLKAKEMGYY